MSESKPMEYEPVSDEYLAAWCDDNNRSTWQGNAAREIVFLRARVDAYEARVKALEARESALRDAFNASVDAGALHGERSGEARLARSRVAEAMAAIVCATPLSAPSGEVTK